MAYTYLLNLYDEIEARLGSLSGQDSAGDGSAGTMFRKGRQDLLNEFKQYLADNMNDKLPKRIKKRISGG